MNSHRNKLAIITLLLIHASLFPEQGKAQGVGINPSGAPPDASAMLDVSSNDKGVLIPRVQLNDVNTQTPISSSPVEGLLIYNETGSEPIGFYYWDGSQWVPINSGSNAYNTNFALNGNSLDITDPNGTLTADLSSLSDSTDPDSVVGNEYNTGLTLNGNTLEVTDGGTAFSVDLSPYADSTDPDSVVGNEYNTDINLNGTILEVTDSGGTVTEDLASLSGSSYWDRNASANDIYPSTIADSVGIGLSTTADRLHVDGNIRLDGTDDVYRIGPDTVVRIGTNDQTYIGAEAGVLASADANSTYLGSQAGKTAESLNSVFIGHRTGLKTKGDQNTFIGVGINSTNNLGDGGLGEGENNVAIGFRAARNIQDNSTRNVLIGTRAGRDLDFTSRNVFIGFEAGMTNVSGGKNTAVGNKAGNSLIDGSLNTLIGNGAGLSLNSGQRNTIIGDQSGQDLTSESWNIMIGHRAGYSNSGAYNTFIGAKAGQNNDFDTATIIGYEAGRSNTQNGVTLIGYEAGEANKGDKNTYIGHGTVSEGAANGADNSVLGYEAGLTLDQAYRNTVFGTRAGKNIGDGNDNVYIGFRAALNNDGSTNDNVVIGSKAAEAADGASGNVILGSEAGQNSLGSGSDNIFIGNQAGQNASGDDQLYIANDNGTPSIYGDLIGDNISISTTNTTDGLQVGTSGDGSEALANSHATFSDRRLKKEFAPIEDPLNKLQAFDGYYYKWKEGEDQSRQIGFIAQEVNKVLPELVSEKNEQGYLALDYSKTTVLLSEAVKEQQAIIEEQQKELEDLKERVRKLEDKGE